MTSEELTKWAKFARPGDAITYHRGFLAVDREESRNASAIQATCDQIDRLYEDGSVSLVQRKIAVRDYEYIAQRTRKNAIFTSRLAA